MVDCGLLPGAGVYSVLRCVWGVEGGDRSICVHFKPDKGMSKISILPWSRLQVGPKEWPPCPWSPASLSACFLEIGRSPGTNEATLHPGIRVHKRGRDSGTDQRQWGRGQLLIRGRRSSSLRTIVHGT